MKKIIICSLMLMLTSSLFSQKLVKGSFSVLSNESVVKIELDYSDALINGVLFEDFVALEENWETGYKEILMKFVQEANGSGNLKYSTKAETNYKLVIKVKNCDRDGETDGSLLLLNKDNEIVAVAEKLNANGGSFGSQMNLMGDAAERLGKKVSNFIKKQTKK